MEKRWYVDYKKPIKEANNQVIDNREYDFTKGEKMAIAVGFLFGMFFMFLLMQ